MNHIFISHKTADDRAVDRLVAELEERGFRCWVDHRDIHHDLDNAGFFADALSRAVKESSAVILFVSGALNANEDSEYLLLEIMRATELKKPRIRLDYETTELPEGIAFMFTGVHHFTFVGRRRSDTLDQLCERLQRIGGIVHTPQTVQPAQLQQPPPPATTPLPQPVPSLQPAPVSSPPRPVKPLPVEDDRWKPPPVNGPSGTFIVGSLLVVTAMVLAIFVSWPSLKPWISSVAAVEGEKPTTGDKGPRDAAAIRSEGIAAANRGDLTTAVPLLKEAAELGDTTAMVELGKLYYYGRGVAEDEEEAKKWLKLAADKGDARAKELYAQVKIFQEEREKKLKEAEAAEQARKTKIASLKAKAEAGDAPSQVDLAVALVDGKDQGEHIAEAVQWLRKAADLGELRAMTELGGLYLQGFGVERDVEKAREWYSKAAAKGHGPAKHNLEVLERTEAEKTKSSETSAKKAVKKL